MSPKRWWWPYVSPSVAMLTSCGCSRVSLNAPSEAVGEVLAARQELLERDGARDRPVVEEDRDAAAGGEAAEVRHASDRRRRVCHSSSPIGRQRAA